MAESTIIQGEVGEEAGLFVGAVSLYESALIHRMMYFSALERKLKVSALAFEGYKATKTCDLPPSWVHPKKKALFAQVFRRSFYLSDRNAPVDRSGL